jgi:hypothetical protein
MLSGFCQSSRNVNQKSTAEVMVKRVKSSLRRSVWMLSVGLIRGDGCTSTSTLASSSILAGSPMQGCLVWPTWKLQWEKGLFPLSTLYCLLSLPFICNPHCTLIPFTNDHPNSPQSLIFPFPIHIQTPISSRPLIKISLPPSRSPSSPSCLLSQNPLETPPPISPLSKLPLHWAPLETPHPLIPSRYSSFYKFPLESPSPFSLSRNSLFPRSLLETSRSISPSPLKTPSSFSPSRNSSSARSPLEIPSPL